MSLTELSYYSRRMLPFVILFLIFFMAIFYVVKLSFIFVQMNKKTVVYINPIFGKITKPQIKEATPSGKISYSLDTVEGEPITASGAAKVYFIPLPYNGGFGYQQKIVLMAKTLGFSTSHTLINDNQQAKFDESKQRLIIDLSNYNFTYESKFEDDKNLFYKTKIPPSSDILTKASTFLKTIDRYPEDLAKGKTNLIYLHYDPLTHNLTIVDRPAIANLVEVDFYRADMDNMATITPSYFNSPNYLLMVFSDNSVDYKVVKAQIKFFEISKEQFGVYPLKKGQDAWQELLDQKGMIVSNPTDKKDVVIKKMTIGYLDPDTYQQYFQPVYVFLGDDNFVGYVPAVTSQFLTE